MKSFLFIILTVFLAFNPAHSRTVEQYFVIAEFDHVARDTKEIVFKHPKLDPMKIGKMPFKINTYVKKNLELGYLPLKLALINTKDLETLFKLRGKEWVFARFRPGKSDKLYLDEMKAFSSLDKLIKNPVINKKYLLKKFKLEKHIKNGIRVFKIKMKVKGPSSSKK